MKILSIPLAALGLASCTATADTYAAQTNAARADTELAEALRGRVVAGPPQNCVQLRTLGGNRSAGDAIIFDGPGSLIYVNRPRGGCPDLRFNRALRTRTFGSQLCSGDIASVFDTTTGIQYGACGLGEFVPYRRVG